MFPDRSGVYLQCRAVYTPGTLQHMQCTGSVVVPVGQNTTLLVPAVYVQSTLYVHCLHTADCSVHGIYTVHTLYMHCSNFLDCRYTASALLLHCRYTASGSVHCQYIANALQIGLLWQHICTLHIHCQ